MKEVTELRGLIDSCPWGRRGWAEFEDVCTATLTFLLVPPLGIPIIQPRTLSGTDRRDAIFPNRNFDTGSIWGQLRHELGARLVLFEFKNYDHEEISKEEVNQTASYMREPMGRLALVCSTKTPNAGAYIKRNTLFSLEKKVILFLNIDHLKEMLAIKERGDDPSNLIMDLVERFYLQHE